MLTILRSPFAGKGGKNRRRGEPRLRCTAAHACGGRRCPARQPVLRRHCGLLSSLLWPAVSLLLVNIGKNESEEKRELIFKEDGQGARGALVLCPGAATLGVCVTPRVLPGAEYAQVMRMLGNGRLEAMCIDGIKRLCHIRGKMRKKVWVNTVRRCGAEALFTRCAQPVSACRVEKLVPLAQGSLRLCARACLRPGVAPCRATLCWSVCETTRTRRRTLSSSAVLPWVGRAALPWLPDVDHLIQADSLNEKLPCFVAWTS